MFRLYSGSFSSGVLEPVFPGSPCHSGRLPQRRVRSVETSGFKNKLFIDVSFTDGDGNAFCGMISDPPAPFCFREKM